MAESTGETSLAAPGMACAGERDAVGPSSAGYYYRSGRRTFPWPGRRPVGSRGALAGHRLIRRNLSFGKAEPSPNQCIRCAVPVDQREGACDAVRAGWRGDVFRHCSKNEPRLRRDTPFDRPRVDHLRSRRVIGQGRPCQSPSPPLPIGPLSGSVQQAGDPPDAPLLVLGEGLTNSLGWIASRRVVGRQIPPRLLPSGFGCARRDAEQEVGTRSHAPTHLDGVAARPRRTSAPRGRAPH